MKPAWVWGGFVLTLLLVSFSPALAQTRVCTDRATLLERFEARFNEEPVARRPDEFRWCFGGVEHSRRGDLERDGYPAERDKLCRCLWSVLAGDNTPATRRRNMSGPFVGELLAGIATLREGQKRQDGRLDRIEQRLHEVERVTQFGRGIGWALLRLGATAAAVLAAWEWLGPRLGLN